MQPGRSHSWAISKEMEAPIFCGGTPSPARTESGSWMASQSLTPFRYPALRIRSGRFSRGGIRDQALGTFILPSPVDGALTTELYHPTHTFTQTRHRSVHVRSF